MDIQKYTEILNTILAGNFSTTISLLNEVQKEMNSISINCDKIYEQRQNFVKEFGWGIPSVEGFNLCFKTVQDKKCLEIGAGSGFLAAVIKNNSSPSAYYATSTRDNWFTFNRNYTDVEELNHNQALVKYPDAQVLILNWPTYGQLWAYETLCKFKGDTVIFSGEGNCGSTAEGCFFLELESNWDKQEYIPNIQWPMRDDGIYVYSRSSNWKSNFVESDFDEISLYP